MIDLHSHILFGIDDGARTVEDSLEIARAAVEDGIGVIACTPHVRDDWPTDVETMEDRVAELRSALDAAGIPLELRHGGEIALEWVDRLPNHVLRRFALGRSRYLLVETPYYGWPLGLPDVLLSLRERGFVPVLAHPERNADVQPNASRLAPLVAGGVLIQVTAASLDGRIGQRPQATGLQLIRDGLAHLVASDAHHASVREVGMRAAVRAVGDDALGRWLTEDVPRAILADEHVPPRPPPRKDGWLGRLLGG